MRKKLTLGDYVLRSLAAIGTMTIFGLMAACFDSSNADSGGNAQADVTQAEFDALLARVEALEADLASVSSGVVRVYAGGSSTAGMQKTAVGTLACGGSLGYAPADVHAGNMQVIYCQTETGYILGLPLTNDPEKTVAPVETGKRTYYATNDCTGQAYFRRGDVGEVTKANGAVFSYSDATGIHVGAVSPDPEIADVDYGSFMEFTECHAATGNQQLIAIGPNEGTGAEDSYSGPIQLN